MILNPPCPQKRPGYSAFYKCNLVGKNWLIASGQANISAEERANIMANWLKSEVQDTFVVKPFRRPCTCK